MPYNFGYLLAKNEEWDADLPDSPDHGIVKSGKSVESASCYV